jgi:hypothetical protein
MHSTAFLVDGDERRQVRMGFPQGAAQRQDLPRLAAIVAKEDETAKAALFDDPSLIPAQRLTLNADHEHLADFVS